MNAPTSTAGGATTTGPPRAGRSKGATLTLLLVGSFVLLSFARVASSSPALTSSSTFSAMLILAVPIGLAGLGGLFAERAGVVNIGLEGMMILGTWGAGWAGYQWGPFAAVLAGMIFGALGGLLHAVATVSFGVDHIVSGVAINILGQGIARFLSEVFYAGNEAGGGVTQSPPMRGDAPTVSLPVLSSGPDLLGSLERRQWFLLSDAAGLLRGLSSGINIFVIMAVLLIPFSWWLLWRTAFGLRLRSCGENPWAADSLGVPVYRMKYIALLISGAMAGLGGVFLVFVANTYREGQTGGRGFIGLAAMIFGNWRPGGLAAGAGLFGFADALQLRSQSAVVALFLLVAIVLGGVAFWQLRRGRRVRAGLAAGFAAAALALWLLVDALPGEFVFFTPHLTTLLVLSLASQRLRMPAADGLRYRRGEDK
ncbi:ABC transporter permease [soil metagenome]